MIDPPCCASLAPVRSEVERARRRVVPLPCASSLLLCLVSVVCAPFFAGLSARAESPETCAESYESAQLFRLQGRFVEAHGMLLTCSQASCPEFIRNDCSSWLPEVRASLPTVVFAVTDERGHDVSNVRVTANGQALTGSEEGRAVSINPGTYTLHFEATGYAPLELPITIREGEKYRIVRARLTRITETARKVPPAAWVLSGVSVASIATSLGLGVAGKREYERLKDACSPTCSDERTKKGRRLYIATDVGLGAAAASAAAALWVYFAHRAKLQSDIAPSFDVDGTQARLTLRRQF